MSSLEVPWVGLREEEEGQEPGGPARRGNSTGRSGVSGLHGVSFVAEDPLRERERERAEWAWSAALPQKAAGLHPEGRVTMATRGEHPGSSQRGRRTAQKQGS